eukprot:scaffold28535_cov55-Attheya_sp.AAC.2
MQGSVNLLDAKIQLLMAHLGEVPKSADDQLVAVSQFGRLCNLYMSSGVLMKSTRQWRSSKKG